MMYQDRDGSRSFYSCKWLSKDHGHLLRDRRPAVSVTWLFVFMLQSLFVNCVIASTIFVAFWFCDSKPR